MLVRQQTHHLSHPYRKLLVVLEWRVMKSLLGQLTTTVGCCLLLYSWYYPQTLFRVLDRQQVWWSTFHVETQRRLVRRIPVEGLDPCGYGIDVLLFATRHLIVVCTQTYIFRCCIVLRKLYADCMRCCILVSVMLWYHVGNPGHMTSSYVAVGPICASSIWMKTSRSGTVPHTRPYSSWGHGRSLVVSSHMMLK